MLEWMIKLLFRGSLARREGTVAVRGLEHDCRIARDERGVPQVLARTHNDGYFGLGYVHAQDRLWQMEMQRRLAAGRLSEIFGKRALPADKFTRTLGLRINAHKSWQAMQEPTRGLLDSYLCGVNAFIQDCPRSAAPPEFRLLKVPLEPWTGTDTFALCKLLAWMLANTYVVELLRHDLKSALGADRMAQLMPGQPLWRERPSPATDVTARRQLDGFAVPASARLSHVEGVGSNMWLVSGRRTVSGAALLANDPHLAASTPNPWYVAAVQAGDLELMGATVPGIPAVVCGRNRHIAWGVTNLCPDVQDLYHETEPSAPHSPAGVIERRVESIQVKGADAVAYEVCSTPRGPILNDVLQGDSEQNQPAGRRPGWLSLRWTGSDSADTSLVALMQMNAARTWAEFNAALRLHVAPALNFGYADVRGNIGLHAAGKVPVRGGHDGATPIAASDRAGDWVRFIDYDSLPHQYNPACGYIVSTNCSPLEPGASYLGAEWVDAHRKERIAQLLAACKRSTPQDHQRIQADVYSGRSHELLSVLLPLAAEKTNRASEALACLRPWDGHADSHSVPMTLFAAWYARLVDRMLTQALGADLYKAYRHWSTYRHCYVRERLQQSASAELTALVTDTLIEALEELARSLGPDMRTWRWERVHRAHFPHGVFDRIPLLKRLASRYVAVPGYWDTVNIAAFDPSDYRVTRHAAMYRQIIDMSVPGIHSYSMAMGQSGHFGSVHYDDALADWCAVRSRSLAPVDGGTSAASRYVLHLHAEPQSDASPRDASF